MFEDYYDLCLSILTIHSGLYKKLEALLSCSLTTNLSGCQFEFVMQIFARRVYFPRQIVFVSDFSDALPHILAICQRRSGRICVYSLFVQKVEIYMFDIYLIKISVRSNPTRICKKSH
jgi:hypothetical protein